MGEEAAAFRAESASASLSRGALLKDSPIVLFDEATAALDAENEAAIVEAMHELARSPGHRHSPSLVHHRRRRSDSRPREGVHHPAGNPRRSGEGARPVSVVLARAPAGGGWRLASEQ